ncbi:Gfo/Idh/MocA family oxidoreductase [Kiritimatiellota bacterium B12222]|nr:Gfo/Idh/MocA family oxidoreductase [Kiritimatiellota bacterium B12222]
MKRIKIGQLGICHEHAAAKIDTLRELSDVFEFVGVVDDRATTANRFAGDDLRSYEGLTWMSEEELFATPGLQAVVVETPNLDLVPTALRCMEQGFHMHMDKPAGNDLALFDQLLKGCQEKQLSLQLGYMLRSNPAVQFCQRIVQEGWLGDVFQVQADMNHDYGGEGYQQYIGKIEGGIMFNLGCHLIDFMVALLGRPEAVTPFLSGTANVDKGIQNNGLAVLSYPHATVTICSCSQAVDGIRQRRLTVNGTKGTFDVQPLELYDGSPIHARLILAEGNAEFEAGSHDIELPGFTDRYRAQFLELAQMINGELVNPYSFEHDRVVQEVVMAASGLTTWRSI